ncbi:MAG: glycerophosphodiester phosphodiesterase family protein [Paracoccaceae bacterium]|nr:glycerophosphodiester phosphodiesterase family protein [Paracoccaceae bacterium]
MRLSGAFLQQPIAHRGLHDSSAQRAENSRAAISAAIDHGYGIEIDLQLSSDGHAMVFHDYELDRVTNQSGFTNLRTAAELSDIALHNSGGETIPTLVEILALIGGRAPLLIELKDQDGQMGPHVGRLERSTAQALLGYLGPIAVMSFNPHSVLQMANLAPDIPRGLTCSSYSLQDWPYLPKGTRNRLRGIPDYDPTKSCFISHGAQDLSRHRVTDLKAQGADVLCWTITSETAETKARKFADNVTFEGYYPAKHS